MGKDGRKALVTPEKLHFLQNPGSLLIHKERPQICIKDVIPSPKKSAKLNLTLKSSRTVKSSSRPRRDLSEYYRLPAFMFDFLDEEKPQVPRPIKDPINIFKTPRKTHKRRRMSQVPNSLTIETEEKFPEIYVHNISDIRNIGTSNEKRPGTEAKSYYKPYIIEITPRSSVTLYGVEPISASLIKDKENKRKRKNYSDIIGLRNMSTEKYRKMDTLVKPVLISAPAKTFAEKLKRVQDIAKEAEKSLNLE